MKQIDPLSHFFIAMEDFLVAFLRVGLAGVFMGMHIEDFDVKVSHLFYAVDAVDVSRLKSSDSLTDY